MPYSQLWPILRLELRRVVHNRATWIGVGVFMLVSAVGAWLYWQTLPPRPSGGRLFGEAYILGLVIALNAGIARDRATRFDAYLVSNLVDCLPTYVSKIVGMLVFLFLYSCCAFVFATIISVGDLSYAGRYAAAFLLTSILIMPAIVLTELGVNTRNPLAILLVVFFVGIAVYSRTGDVKQLLHMLGMDGELEIGAAAVRTTLALLATLACYPLYRLRLGKRSLAGIAVPP